MGTVVAVVGTIPGAGATTVVATVGAALAERNHRVAIVDGTTEGSRVGDVLPIGGGGELADALRRGAVLGDVQSDGPHGLAIFRAGPDTSWGSMRPDAVANTYDDLRGRFDVVLVDVGSSLTPASAPWLGHADDAIVVTDPDVAGAVDETAALARAFDVDVTGIVANRVPPKDVEDALDALEATGLRVLAVLPEDRAVGAAEAERETVFAYDPDSPMASVAWSFAGALLSGNHADVAVPRGTLTTQGGGGSTASTDGRGTSDVQPGGRAGDDTRRSATDDTGSTQSDAPGSGQRTDGSASTSENRTEAEPSRASPEQPTGTAVGHPTQRGDATPDRGSDRRASQILSGSESDAGTEAGGAANADETDDESGPDRFEFGETEQEEEESSDDGQAELTDEEIEDVFKETMERVKKRQERREEE